MFSLCRFLLLVIALVCCNMINASKCTATTNQCTPCSCEGYVVTSCDFATTGYHMCGEEDICFCSTKQNFGFSGSGESGCMDPICCEACYELTKTVAAEPAAEAPPVTAAVNSEL
eukprot:GDKK01013574.1.p1 GENE.GDKK01013574.1~~GDKK01013574.1.p1  ORF type:complete len:115 (+),score=5.89 GDKK01013574.1:52-396(+)